MNGESPNKKSLLITDFIKKVPCLYPETPLLECIDLFLNKDFKGLPVVNQYNRLIGLVNESDLIVRGSFIHLPTFFKLFQEFDLYKKDKKFLNKEIKKIASIKIKDVMDTSTLAIHQKNKVEKAIRLFNEFQHINTIPVVDDANRVVGIINRSDLIKLTPQLPIALIANENERETDREINKFLKDFDSKFIFVSRLRTRLWLFISILFSIIGFIIAFALILKIRIKN